MTEYRLKTIIKEAIHHVLNEDVYNNFRQFLQQSNRYSPEEKEYFLERYGKIAKALGEEAADEWTTKQCPEFKSFRRYFFLTPYLGRFFIGI